MCRRLFRFYSTLALSGAAEIAQRKMLRSELMAGLTGCTAASLALVSDRIGPFTSYQGKLRPNFAKVANCALLPLVVITSNGGFQPFYDIRAGCSGIWSTKGGQRSFAAARSDVLDAGQSRRPINLEPHRPKCADDCLDWSCALHISMDDKPNLSQE